jgi:hypothetical protein
MSKNHLLALAMIAGTSATVLAAPRESVTFTAVDSNWRQGEPDVVSQTHTFAGSDAGGSYTAQYLRLSGQLTRVTAGSYGSEATILITPPTGTPFLAHPFTFGIFPTGQTTVSIPDGSIAIPVSSIGTAGQWSFSFFESFDDGRGTTSNGVDSTWDTLTVTLDDGAAPLPAVPATPAIVLNGINVDGLAAAPGFSQQLTVPAGSGQGVLRISFAATSVNAETAANLAINATPMSNLRLRLTNSAGVQTVITPFGLNAGSSAVRNNLQIALPTTGYAPGDTFTLEAYTIDDSPLGVDCHIQRLVMVFEAPTPPGINGSIGSVALNGTATNTSTYDAGSVKWFTFNVAADHTASNNRAFQIDTEGSANTNPSLAVYNPNGLLVASDLDDGSLLNAALSFGADDRPLTGGVTFNGRDGNLNAGNYFLAVASGNATFSPLFITTNTGTVTGDITVTLRSFDPGITPATPPSDAIELGSFTDAPPLSEENVVSSQSSSDTVFQWYTFQTAVDASSTSGYYMDMDTSGSGSSTVAQDVEIGLWNAIGGLRDNDDDSGPGLWSQLSFGGSVARPAVPASGPATGAGAARTGSDGALLAGRYYAVVVDFAADFSPRFTFTNGGVAGIMAINLRTNMAGGGGTPTSPCGPADIAGGGASPGADNFLDNNDFIYFIQLFFENAPAADIAGGGAAPGADGAWDNNDFILFIQTFFDGGAASGCNGNP